MKTKFTTKLRGIQPCLELCMKVHDSSSEAVGISQVASSVRDLMFNNVGAIEHRKLTEELDGLLTVDKQYVIHLFRGVATCTHIHTCVPERVKNKIR